MVAMGDTHCGHMCGLTPPNWQNSRRGEEWKKLIRGQKQLWSAYVDALNDVRNIGGQVNVLLVMGDLIDGRSEKSHAWECWWPDGKEQRGMAMRCLREANAETVRAVRGSPYHVGRSERWEDLIIEALGGTIESQQYIDVNGLIFNLKHKTGNRSSVPHGRFTPLARADLWDELKGSRGTAPKSDIILRAHCHHYGMIGTSRSQGYFVPALQGFTGYGEESNEGDVDFGLLQFLVWSKEKWQVIPHFIKVSAYVQRATKV